MRNAAIFSLVLAVTLTPTALRAQAVTPRIPSSQQQTQTPPVHARVTRYVMVQVATVAELNAVATRHHLHTSPLMPRAGIYRAWSDSVDNALALIRELSQEVRTRHLLAVEPDYELEHRRAAISIPPNDARYGGQWYLDRIGIEGAWRINTGAASTTVAVIDNGCDLEHPDLASKLLPGLDVFSNDNDPSYLPSVDGNTHGTACAGLVGAVTDNSIGIAGTCPECSLRCVRLLGPPGSLTPLSSDVMAFNFALENDVDVLSNSWGYEHGTPVSFMLRTAVETVLTEGRGGLGAVVVFAAGNDAAQINANELEAIDGVVTVGALNNFDESAPFSNFGPSLDIVAPTGTLALDISGADGDVDGDYTSLFGGTSSSAPIVAGVAALIISQRPSITGAEVAELLRTSARAAPFATPDENGHDPVYGYGVVDPESALRTLVDVVDAGVEDASVEDAAGTADAGAPTEASGCQCSVGPKSSSPESAAWLALGSLFFALLGRSQFRRVASASVSLIVCAACAVSPPSAEVGRAETELRPDTPGTTELPPRFDPTDSVETLASPGGHFRIHYTRAGRNAVPSADVDSTGVPDYVELVARTYDSVLAFYQSLSYRTPIADTSVPTDNGGDASFDVYLVDFGGSADGAYRRELCDGANGCTGYMLQENDFVGYAYPSVEYGARLLASHEYFHAVQAAYDGERSAQGSVLSEGTAVWASEQFDASQFDLEGFASAYFERTDKSLGVDPIGPVQSYSYGSAVFFEFLSQHYNVDVIRRLWDEVHANPELEWLISLDAVLHANESAAFDDAFVEFAKWNWFTDARAQAGIGYTQAANLPLVTDVVGSLPYEDTSVRMQPASIRYFRVNVASGAPVTIRLASSSAIEGVRVLATTVTGNELQPPSEVNLVSGSVTVPSAAAALLLALVDTRTSGSGQVVSICVATTASGQCATATPTDAGLPADDAGEVDAGVVAPIETPAPSSGCNVSATTNSKHDLGAALLILIATGWLVRRRLSSPRARPQAS